MNRKQQSRLVIIGAVLVICASATTAYVVDRMKNLDGEFGSEGYRNVTFTDANIRCEHEVKAAFGERLLRYHVDTHSSRYDDAERLYKIFMVAYVGAPKMQGVEMYVTCLISAANGRIDTFEYIENMDTPSGGAIRKGGEKFIQWPQ